MKNYEKIMRLNSEIIKIKKGIKPLRNKAVLELYEMGYSMDRICSILFIAKIDVIDIINPKRKGGKK